MYKKSINNIPGYYSKKEIVKDYDSRRFRGFGGKYIEENEVDSNLHPLKTHLMPAPSIKILDIGAGRGRLSVPLLKLGYKVYCLDSSPEMVKILKRGFPERRVFLQSAFEPLKRSLKFDAITSLRFFDHFSISDQNKLLSNFNKNLKKDGYIVFCALNKNSIEYLLSKILYFGKLNFYYTVNEYEKLFNSLGFKIIDFKSRFFLPRGIFLYSQSIPILAKILMRVDSLLNKYLPKNSALLIFLLKK